VQSGILPLFWDLAALDADVRLRAASSLVSALQTPAPATEPAATAADLLARCAPETAYTLKRLLRGLASDREGARQGFAIALTEVQSLCPRHLLLGPVCSRSLRVCGFGWVVCSSWRHCPLRRWRRCGRCCLRRPRRRAG
jgi:hypothetical protein